MPTRKNVPNSSRPNHAARSAHAKASKQFKSYDTSAVRQGGGVRPAIVLAVVIAVIAIVIFGVVRGCMTGSSRALVDEGAEVTVVIEEGASANSIGQQLEEYGLVSRAAEFTEEVNNEDAAANLKPGTYVFTGGTPVADLVAQISAGPEYETVTIPEGTTVSATASLVDAATDGRISADDFSARANNASDYQADYPFLSDAYDDSLEGYLFPKTYEIAKEDTADSLVRKMLDQYQAEVADVDYSYAESKNLTQYDVLILASIVERESTSDVRAEVASVFYNRLSGGMPLQSDATTAYLINGDPTPEDLENTAENPYNTQYNYGLPPGPICSPSIESIEAAAHPADTDFLYFYFEQDADGDMQYYFSTTYEEHQAAINGQAEPYKVASASSDDDAGESTSSADADDGTSPDAAEDGDGAGSDG